VRAVAWFVGLSFAAACGDSSADPDAIAWPLRDSFPGARTTWAWFFRDASTGELVGCPAGVGTVELTAWKPATNIGHSCSDSDRPTFIASKTFPCAPGTGAYDTDGTLVRLDVKTTDGRIYARHYFDTTKTASTDITFSVPRGFGRLVWSIVDADTKTEMPCSYDGIKINVPWLGTTERISCLVDSPRTYMLPAQPVGTHDLDVVLRQDHFCPGNLATTTVTGIAIAQDAVTDINATLER
jgi:hypothetical protein